MKHAIEILKKRIEKLQTDYFVLVENGKVHPEDNIAMNIRAELKSCEDAIEILTEKSDMPRSFGMVRWHDNVDENVACVSIEKAEEYVEKYNKLAGEDKCYVDKDIWLLLNEA